MAQITNFDRETFLIHTLELKLWLFEVCIGSHSLAMFAKKVLRAREKNFTGARRTLTTLYRRLCILLFGCLLDCMALLRIQLDCVVLFGPFFSHNSNSHVFAER